MKFFKENWRFLSFTFVCLWAGFVFYTETDLPFVSFQKAQESKYGMVDHDAYFMFTQSYSFFVLFILCLPLVVYFFKLGEKTKNKLDTTFSIASFVALITKPLVYGIMLQINAANLDGQTKITSCTVLYKFTYRNEVTYYRCSPFEVGRQTLNIDLFASLNDGDRVAIEVYSGVWMDWIRSTKKIAN